MAALTNGKAEGSRKPRRTVARLDAESRTDADAKCDAAEAEVRSKEGDADTSIKFVASPRLSRLHYCSLLLSKERRQHAAWHIKPRV